MSKHRPSRSLAFPLATLKEERLLKQAMTARRRGDDEARWLS